WIDFYYMQKLLTQDGAVADAQALKANNQPVGVPALPIFDKATYDQSQQWIEDVINVPTDQMVGFTSKIFHQPVVRRIKTLTTQRRPARLVHCRQPALMAAIVEAVPAAKPAARRRPMRRRPSRDDLGTLAFLLPLLVVFAVFAWFPILRAVVMSVQKTNLVSE